MVLLHKQTLSRKAFHFYWYILHSVCIICFLWDGKWYKPIDWLWDEYTTWATDVRHRGHTKYDWHISRSPWSLANTMRHQCRAHPARNSYAGNETRENVLRTIDNQGEIAQSNYIDRSRTEAMATCCWYVFLTYFFNAWSLFHLLLPSPL